MKQLLFVMQYSDFYRYYFEILKLMPEISKTVNKRLEEQNETNKSFSM